MAFLSGNRLAESLGQRWTNWFGLKIPARCAGIYFEAAHSEYRSQKGLAGSRTDPAIEAQIEQLAQEYRDDPGALSMTDAIFFERLAVRLLPDAALRRKVMNTRQRFRQMVSGETYQTYVDGGPPNPIDARIDDVQADLDDLLGRMEMAYVISPFREEMRTQISIRVGSFLAAMILLAILSIWVSYASQKASSATTIIPPIVIASLVGAIGGLFSVQQRIQTTPSEGDAIGNVMSLHNGMFSVYLAPVIGSLSACLFFLMILAGYIQGNLLPDYQAWSSPGRTTDLKNFFLLSGPTDGVGYAKMILWSFLAGFAERLVPDVLSRIVSTVQVRDGSAPRPVVQPPSTTPTPPPGPPVPTNPARQPAP